MTKGFSNWKDATVAFPQHEESACHKEAVEMLTLPATTPNVGEMLSSTLAKEKAANRHCLLKQGRVVASEDMMMTKREISSNCSCFWQKMILRYL